MDVKTTMIFTHVLNRGGRAVRSPLDVREERAPVRRMSEHTKNAQEDDGLAHFHSVDRDW